MSLSANITKLAALGATVSGVKNSYDLDATPTSFQPALLPAFIYMPFGGKIDVRSFDGLWAITHRVKAQLAYCAAAQGTLAKNVDGVITILDAFLTALKADDDLTGSCDVVRASDYSRLGDFTYGGVDYFGIEITVEIVELVE